MCHEKFLIFLISMFFHKYPLDKEIDPCYNNDKLNFFAVVFYPAA
jgi:hypothetical protein